MGVGGGAWVLVVVQGCCRGVRWWCMGAGGAWGAGVQVQVVPQDIPKIKVGAGFIGGA